MNLGHLMIGLYALVIVMATTLPWPAMIALQAALGGFAIGWRLERLLKQRRDNALEHSTDGRAGSK